MIKDSIHRRGDTREIIMKTKVNNMHNRTVVEGSRLLNGV